MQFVPVDFKVPERLETPHFTIRKLCARDVYLDYLAVMSSIDLIKKTYGGSSWPEPDLTIEDDLIDLAWHQREISQQFATPLEDKFAGIDHETGIGGSILLSGCAVTYECHLVHEFVKGDHVVLIGEVQRFQDFHREPLIFFRGDHRFFEQPHVL